MTDVPAEVQTLINATSRTPEQHAPDPCRMPDIEPARCLISWIDQRIKKDASVEVAIAFFWAGCWPESG
jgi:hypothetical protein